MDFFQKYVLRNWYHKIYMPMTRKKEVRLLNEGQEISKITAQVIEDSINIP